VSGSDDNTIKIWNTEGECIKTLEGHSECVNSVAIDGDRIVSGSDDNTIKIWNTEGECIKTLEGHSEYVNSVAIDGDRIVSGSDDHTIKIWNTEGECIKTLEGHSDWVNSVAIDGDRIVSGSDDKTIKIWKINNTSPVGTTIDLTTEDAATSYDISAADFSNVTELLTRRYHRYFAKTLTHLSLALNMSQHEFGKLLLYFVATQN
jgi:WD40 repeat protein